MHLVVFIIRE